MYGEKGYRFVREYANYKIRILKDVGDSEDRIALIEKNIKAWHHGYIPTDELMRLISEA